MSDPEPIQLKKFETDVELPLFLLLDHIQDRNSKESKAGLKRRRGKEVKMYLAQKDLGDVLPELQKELAPLPIQAGPHNLLLHYSEAVMADTCPPFQKKLVQFDPNLAYLYPYLHVSRIAITAQKLLAQEGDACCISSRSLHRPALWSGWASTLHGLWAWLFPC